MSRVPERLASINKHAQRELKNPALVVLARVFLRGRVKNPLSPNARLLACAIASRLRGTDDGSFACWAPVSSLVFDTGLSRATIYRVMNELCEGDSPLFARSFPGSTTVGGKVFTHESPRYSLILSPAPFVKAREETRAAKSAATQQEVHLQKLGLQKRLLLGGLSQAEYDRECNALEFEKARQRRQKPR